MARYTGPKTKIARKLGEPIFGEDKYFAKKNYPPGQHGTNRRRKLSEYGTQLREKQKAKYTYGVLERQFRNLFNKASRMKGVTGEVLLQLLEARLDNIVYRLGIGSSMVRSLKYWLRSARIIDPVTHKLSEFGELLYRYDRYLEDPFCWFLIHFFLEYDNILVLPNRIGHGQKKLKLDEHMFIHGGFLLEK